LDLSRGWARLLLLPLLGGLGCDLSVHPFSGTIIQMSIQGVTREPAPDTHLELWARTQYDDIVRIDANNSVPNGATFAQPGYIIRKAITMGDPCIIDGQGNLLVTAAAYPSDVTVDGIPQSPQEQAIQVQNRIKQLTSTSECDPDGVCGGQTSQLLAVIPYDPNTPPHTCAQGETAGCMPWTMPAADRLTACQAWWNAGPLTYTPNPAQITGPLHGTVYGFIAFQTNPPNGPYANYDGIRIDSPTNLAGIRELFLTTESATVDPNNRGAVMLDGFPTPGGRDVVFINLMGTGVSGSASLLVDVNQDPVQF
jgi:hypothetical protein